MITEEQKRELSAMPYWDDYLCFPQPCWHGIFPGKTPMKEALLILEADSSLRLASNRERVFTWGRISTDQAGWAGGYIEDSWRNRGVVHGIYINETGEHELRMKDAVIIYGTPLALYYVFSEGPKADGIYVYFSGNVVARVYDLLNPKTREIYPDSHIIQMHYWALIYEVPSEHPWTGYSHREPS